MKPTLSATVYHPIALFRRRLNHCPTSVMLTTDSALCPKPRESVMRTQSQTTPHATLIKSTVTPRAAATAVKTVRLPQRSSRRPTPRPKSAPRSVAHRLICANSTRPIFKSTSNLSVMSPSPCVRPGSVPTIASAATPTFTHP
jgi:hypothetical protein